jgi:SAM-dependent methyltransferase
MTLLREAIRWHDAECGSYRADLPLWRELAAEAGGPVLDVGAGTGRVALDLASHGYGVTALDRDADLLAELAQRAAAAGVEIATAHGDARALGLGRRFALIVVPMQTIQLLGGAGGRARFFERAAAHLTGGGLLAAAIVERLQPYDAAAGPPLDPDVIVADGRVFESRPTALRALADRYVLERERLILEPDGSRHSAPDRIDLDRVSASALEREGAAARLTPAGRRRIAATADHTGSTVVTLRA